MSSKLVALVTGGNRGIGKEVVRQLAAKNTFDVILGARNEAQGADVATEIGKETGTQIHVVALDVESTESVKAAAEKIKAQFGGLDVLINNAGYATKGSLLNEEIASKTISVNLFGVMRVNEHMIPILRNNARIINVSSSIGQLSGLQSEVIRGRFTDPSLTYEGVRNLAQEFIREVAAGTHEANGWGTNSYRISKVALNSLTKVMHKDPELKARGITVNAVCPGWCKTDMGGPTAIHTAAEGADTITWLASAPLSEIGNTGAFFRARTQVEW